MERKESTKDDELNPVLRLNTSRLIKLGEDTTELLIPVNSTQLKSLKQIIRSDELTIPPYVEYLYCCLERSSSERRHVILSLFDYFFTRSHQFRLNTIERLQDLLRLVCEVDPLHHPLPPKKEAAKLLKLFAIKTIKRWHEKYGVGYEKLQNVSQYLQMSKALDFDQASAELLIEKQRKEAELRKAAEKTEKICTSISGKFSTQKIDIDRCLTEIDSALEILVPFFGRDEEGEGDNREIQKEASVTEKSKLHGFSSNQTISINLDSVLPTVEISEENEDLVQALRDARVMLDVYRTLVAKWLRKLTECGATQNIVKELIQMKTRLDGYCEKIDELKLGTKKSEKKVKSNSHEGSDSGEDSDFEDVPEKQLEDFLPPDEVPKYIMDRIAMDDQQPCCSKTIEKQGKIEPSSSIEILDEKEEEKSSVPTLSFGLDLKYWGQEKRERVQIPKNNADCHRFWRPADDEGAAHESSSVYETRVFTFIGEEKRPRRACRARLSNGKLCPRRDAERCPVHGLVVDRDEEGFPVSEIKEHPTALESINKDQEREDEEYMRDLEAGTGRSFLPKKKKSKKSGGEGSNVRERLEKKLLDKRAVKRVSEVLEAVRTAKMKKKFGGQFVHSLSR